MLNVGKQRAAEKGKWECLRMQQLLWAFMKDFGLIYLHLLGVNIFLLILIGYGEDGSLVWVEGNAESSSFQDDSVDGYTIAFGIRNVTHIEKVLSEAHRLVCIFLRDCCDLYNFEANGN